MRGKIKILIGCLGTLNNLLESFLAGAKMASSKSLLDTIRKWDSTMSFNELEESLINERSGIKERDTADIMEEGYRMWPDIFSTAIENGEIEIAKMIARECESFQWEKELFSDSLHSSGSIEKFAEIFEDTNTISTAYITLGNSTASSKISLLSLLECGELHVSHSSDDIGTSFQLEELEKALDTSRNTLLVVEWALSEKTISEEIDVLLRLGEYVESLIIKWDGDVHSIRRLLNFVPRFFELAPLEDYPSEGKYFSISFTNPEKVRNSILSESAKLTRQVQSHLNISAFGLKGYTKGMLSPEEYSRVESATKYTLGMSIDMEKCLRNPERLYMRLYAEMVSYNSNDRNQYLEVGTTRLLKIADTL